MKSVAFILSLFILVLSMVPCSDNENCNEPSLELAADHSDHDHEEDSCTPFCSCSCCGCGGFVISTPLFYEAPQKITKMAPATGSYYSDFTSYYYYSFWQPPKLS